MNKNKMIIMETDDGYIIGDVVSVSTEISTFAPPMHTVNFNEKEHLKHKENIHARLFCAFNDPRIYDMSDTVPNRGLAARKVIFNPPATIVLWEDGKRTVVKCDKDDEYDEMKGLALCYMKKALGNTSRELNKALRKGRSYGQALQTD